MSQEDAVTIIAAALDGHQAVIGSDTRGTGSLKADFGDKIVRVHEVVAAGASGSYTERTWLGKGLRDALAPVDPTNWDALLDAIEQSWDARFQWLRDRGHGKADDYGSMALPAMVLLATPGAILTLSGDGSVLVCDDDQFAIGSGDQVAMGAMHALRHLGAEERVRAGIEAAIRYADGCGGNVCVHRLGSPDEEGA